MRTLFKLAVVLLVGHALFRFVPPYWNFTQFKWSLKERALEWREHSDSEVVAQVLALADGNQVPISAEHVRVRRQGDHLYIDVAYAATIEFVPRVEREWMFATSVDAWTLGATSPLKPR